MTVLVVSGWSSLYYVASCQMNWNNCGNAYCHTCAIAIVTVVSQPWNKCDNSLWNKCDNSLWNKCDNNCGTTVTIGIRASTVCVLLAHKYRLTDKFAVSLSVSILIYCILVSYT